jgi:hypothetical protein
MTRWSLLHHQTQETLSLFERDGQADLRCLNVVFMLGCSYELFLGRLETFERSGHAGILSLVY